LIRKINYAHSTVSDDDRRVVKFIGILDIFGFEILGVNSFEQLCINFTNERLQQQFNEHVFVLEQKDYAKEGLQWSSIAYRDNQNVIDLISKKPLGLLNILEEHGMMNRKPDDAALLAAYNSAHEKSVQSYAKTRFAGVSFIVKHFAGDVTYSIDGFLNKNNNCLQDDLEAVINRTENVFIQNIVGSLMAYTGKDSDAANQRQNGIGFIPAAAKRDDEVPATDAAAPGASSSSKKMASADTVSFQFRNQLDQLISTLRATHPHYIKCIKANSLKRPGIFEAPLVLKQLRYSGALEVVRIRREGYPTRMLFTEFYDECWLLSCDQGWKRPGRCSDEEAKSYSVAIAGAHLEQGKFQAGHTMIFLTDGSLFSFHRAILVRMNRASVRLQGWYRRIDCKCKFSVARRAIFHMQHYIRKFVRKCRALKEV
jgi:myosin-5